MGRRETETEMNFEMRMANFIVRPLLESTGKLLNLCLELTRLAVCFFPHCQHPSSKIYHI